MQLGSWAIKSGVDTVGKSLRGKKGNSPIGMPKGVANSATKPRCSL